MKRILALMLALVMVFGTFVSCVKEKEPENTEKQTEENEATEKQTDKKETTDSKETEYNSESQKRDETETEDSTESMPEYARFAHSETYNKAKEKWANIWNDVIVQDSKQGFLAKPAPFKFLAQQGLVYYNEQGEPRAYGTDDNFDNIRSIQSKAWIDPNSPENDFYLLTQYISAPIDDNHYNDDTYVATFMLKYTIDEDCYRDLLLLSGDYRCNLLIQQIDMQYTPEVISKSVIEYELIDGLGLFGYLPYNGVAQTSLDYYKKDVANYVANIDIPNMKITVNFNTIKNKGQIYSYTYSLKETYSWEAMLKGNLASVAVSKDYRDSLTPEQIMLTKETPAGPALIGARVGGWNLNSSSSHQATATLLYDLEPLEIDGTAISAKVNRYESGTKPYSTVNDLTWTYVENLLRSE